MLRDGLEGTVFLDGFSGTGAVGLEALSRGASTAVFIESFYPAVKAIRENAAACGAGDRALVMHRDFNRAVIELAGKGVKFDIIVLDPPYLMLKDRNPLKIIRKRALLKPGGLIVLRHFDKIEPPRNDFYLVRQVHVGDDILSFFRRPEDEPESGKTGAQGGLKKTRPSVKIGRTKSKRIKGHRK